MSSPPNRLPKKTNKEHEGVTVGNLYRPMLPYRESRLAKIALVVFFVLLLGYAYFEARAVLYGPQIHIPTQTIVVKEPYTEIRGQASYISELRMNGAMVSVTEDGKFAEEMLLAEGENRVILDARDKFGRTKQEVLKIYYQPSREVPSVGTSTINQ